MGKLITRAVGIDGEVELLTDRVIINRTGIMNKLKYGSAAKREIPLSSIASVNFCEATVFKQGSIDFDFAGRSQRDTLQNAVRFTKKNQGAFLQLKERLFTILEKRNS